jgi:SagB-type dehydrogenase family enzyme
METIQKMRNFLKSGSWRDWDQLQRDQKDGLPAPPLQKPFSEAGLRIDLVPPDQFQVGQMPFVEAVGSRRSRRKFTGEPLSLEELSFLCWATQGIRQVSGDGTRTYRTVPSAGARHPLETYLIVNWVQGLEPGLYRYLALDHQLGFVAPYQDLKARTTSGEWFSKDYAVTFAWTVIPYRSEWRYTILAHKMIALDAGHVCQNLYLACESCGLGVYAIGAYFQDELDAILDLDGQDEFTIYLAQVGRVSSDKASRES